MPRPRHPIAFGLAVLLALQARAAIVNLPIPSEEVQDLLQLPDGRLAVSGATLVHIIDPRGKVERDVEIAVPGVGAAVAYRKGFVTWGRNAATTEVRYFELGQLPREQVLHSSDAADYLYLAAPPAGDSLYVAESLRRGGMRLTRFNDSGQLSWARSYEDLPLGVTAVNDGVVFMRTGPEQNNRPGVLLTKLGLDGEEAWSSPAGHGIGVPTVRFHSQKAIAVANLAADASLELVNYDSGTGRQISHARFPVSAKFVGTADGLLLLQSYLYRPYIALLDSAGSIRWWRRYTPTESMGVPVTGLVSQAGQLVLLTQNADQNQAPSNKVVFMRRSGEELSDGLNACTRRDPLPVLQAEQGLRAQHAIDVALDFALTVPQSPGSGCPHPTEDEYASAVFAIADRFVRAEARDQGAERVSVRIMATGPAMQLTSYYIGMGPADAPESNVAFDIRYDNAKAFAGYLQVTVFPHMSRIQAARRTFVELTGQSYGAHAPQVEITDPDEFFAQMERATAVLESRVRTVSSSSWPRHQIGAILYPTQFGGSPEKMKPLAVAGQTLIELMQKAEEGQL